MSTTFRTIEPDPLRQSPSETVEDGEYIILEFSDGRQLFAHCIRDKKKCQTKLKVNKKHYPTQPFIGLKYGTVLELNREKDKFVPLPLGEDLIPEVDETLLELLGLGGSKKTDGKNNDGATTAEAILVNDLKSSSALTLNRDNRNLVDNNTSQAITHERLEKLKEDGKCGAAIIKELVENSSTFAEKTEFSKQKYIKRKQKKYQLRCRVIRCTGATVCEAMFLKDQRRIMSLRQDSLAQILSYANVHAGSQVLVFDTCLGLVCGALAQRMGGYGKILSLYTGQQPHAFFDMLGRFNLSYGEMSSILWVHSGEVFGSNVKCGEIDVDEEDVEKAERDCFEWPCPLQSHTAKYLGKMKTDEKREEFLYKRSARFARKLARHTTMETRTWLHSQSDSLIIVSKYDPLPTLRKLLPFLASSCPFVVFGEHMEPLAECLHALKRENLAINLRLSDTWMREYQMLAGRSHPDMTMSQSGGFILTGMKLDPIQGINEIDEKVLQEMRSMVMRGRRHKKKRPSSNINDQDDENKKHARKM
mmetsp:Transcript_11353/g.17029  ORF Transcript_11353/g.17029 Transcript_11353/m.17029 type:complete len:532 (-) Transcript_11353:218-1813(-)